ncbi:hypothetical protein AALP_AA7G255300 [Arabis alpina]|uniref:Glabrous enhancer-binding protein-like DBD domain-containing protein n=1 Tax=Arabis alpina TaxID=50452 RepID=A0A087GKJ2_ARAAL|nr:hypothetical protein AALP_AA7G255300 [Arabis alpina]
MDSIDSDDSDINRFEIRINDRASSLSSQLTRKRDDDEEEVSDQETKLIKKPRTSTTTLVTSSTPSKITLTKNDELLILKGIEDYEEETKLSYRSEWDAFYAFIKDSIELNFTKEQLRSKIRKLKKRFTDNLAKSGHGKGPSFNNSNEEEIFQLSMVIWGEKNEIECASNVNMDQATDSAIVEHEQIKENVELAKDATSVELESINENVEQEKADLTNVEHEHVSENVAQAEELTCVEHEQITQNIEQPKDFTNVEHEQSNENVEQAEDVTHVEREQINENMAQAEDATYVEHEQITENMEQTKVDNGENETNNEKVGAEEFSVLQDAFEATLFPRLDTTHQKLMLENLRNLKAEKGKELTEEWKTLLVEEIKFNVMKLTFSAKLVEA